MGQFTVSVQVSPRAGGAAATVEALVDTGATYSSIPRDVLEALGVVPEEEWPFVLADGREVTYPVAWMSIRMRDRVQPTIVVFGDAGSQPILGMVTLEEFRLAVDPVNRRLVSVPARLGSAVLAA
jgi:clan AA aspartic protease